METIVTSILAIIVFGALGACIVVLASFFARCFSEIFRSFKNLFGFRGYKSNESDGLVNYYMHSRGHRTLDHGLDENITKYLKDPFHDWDPKTREVMKWFQERYEKDIEGDTEDNEILDEDEQEKLAVHNKKNIVCRKITSKSSGSGFLVNSGPYVITNNHVVALEIETSKGPRTIKPSEIYVTFVSKERVKAKIHRGDSQNDLAILELTRMPKHVDIQNLNVNSSKDMHQGDYVFTLGYPLNEELLDIRFSKGDVTGLSGLKGVLTEFQIDVPIQPGNSGGPLFNEDGDVVGVIRGSYNSFALLASGTEAVPQNVNFAIRGFIIQAALKNLPQKMLSKSASTVKGMDKKEMRQKLKNNVVLIECAYKYEVA